MLKSYKHILLLLFLSFTISLFSQIKITGTIKDTNQSIAFANVIFTKGTVFKGTTTDNNGSFTILLDKGNYQLTVSFIGYKTYSKQIKITKNVTLDTILLEKDKYVLKEVVINQKKEIIKQVDDKLIFDVSHSYLKTGYNGVEILKRVPSVYVNTNENIFLRNEKATILVNGRRIKLSGEALTDYIKSIAANDIKQIEVQQMSSAETDANVQGGIINFKLKKKQTGFRESFKYYFSKLKEYKKHYAHTNFNYGTKKWNIYGTALYKNSPNGADIETSIFYTNHSKRYDEKSKLVMDLSKLLVGRFGTTFTPKKHHELGIEIYGSKYDFGTETNSNLNIFADDLLVDNGITKTNNLELRTYYNTSLNYTIALDSLDGKLDFIADYANQYLNRNINGVTSYNLGVFEANSERNKTRTNTNLISAKLDFTKKIKEIAKISTGVKWSTTSRTNNTLTETLENNIFITDFLRTTRYNFKEDIYAAYLTTTKNILKNITVKLGLRVENTNLKGNEITKNTSVSKNYVDYFPHLYIAKKIGKKKSLSFSYNRKIKRPKFRVLSPYITKINDFYYQIGNPNLQPEYRNNVDLSYHFNGNSVALYNKNTKNLMLESYFIINDISYYQFKNDGDNNRFGINFSYRKKLYKKWYFKLNTSVYNQYYKLFEKRFNYNTFTINVINDFKISNTWKTTISTYYTSSNLVGNYLVSPNFVTNFNIGKTLLKKQLKLRFYVTDVFNTKRDKDLAKFSNFSTGFYRKRNTRAFSIWAMFIIDTKGKVRKKKNTTSNNLQRL